MRTPIKYIGGKTKMLPNISPLIPDHTTYMEPFCGGAAVFFAKKPSPIEILNDINGNVTNFYRVMKTDFFGLHEKINCTLHCEHTYNEAKEIYLNSQSKDLDPVLRAWAFWVCSVMSFGGEVAGTFAWSGHKIDNWSPASSIKIRRNQFAYYSKRLSKVSIREKKGEDLIIDYSGSKDLFVYADPPYVGAGQGHYAGYNQEDFNRLITSLSTMEGKFLLSSYPNEELTKFVDLFGWNQKKIEKKSDLSPRRMRKTEVLTYNYNIEEKEPNKTLNIFDHQPCQY